MIVPGDTVNVYMYALRKGHLYLTLDYAVNYKSKNPSDKEYYLKDAVDLGTDWVFEYEEADIIGNTGNVKRSLFLVPALVIAVIRFPPSMSALDYVIVSGVPGTDSILCYSFINNYIVCPESERREQERVLDKTWQTLQTRHIIVNKLASGEYLREARA